MASVENRPPSINLQIAGQEAEFMLDTASAYSIVSADRVDQWKGLPGVRISAVPLCKFLVTVDGKRIYPTGTLRMELEINANKVNWEALIVKNPLCELLIGIDWMRHFGATIDLERNLLSSPHFGAIPTISRSEKSSIKGFDHKAYVDSCSSLFDEAQLTEEQKLELKDVLQQYASVLAPFPGCTTAFNHRIRTLDVPPIRCKAYPESAEKKKFVEAEIDKLLKLGVIVRSTSEWVSPSIVVSSKDPKSNKKRLCLDLRRLNKVIVKDSFPTPTVEGVLNSLKRPEFMTTMDLSMGYFQIPINPLDQHKTGFVCSQGIFHFSRIPFGEINALSSFSRCLRKVLPLADKFGIIIFVDDIFIASETWEEHIAAVKYILSSLHAAGMTLNLKKCSFAQKQSKVLGFIITKEGIEVDPDRTAAIRECQPPKNLKQLRQFLGACNFLRRFIPGFAEIATPMNALLKSNVPWIWGETEQQAFQALKDKLVNPPVLATPLPTGRYSLQTDASAHSIGGVLFQEQAGVQRVIAYGSRSLTTAERKQSTTFREALACVFFCEKYREFLLRGQFDLVTDHKSLAALPKMSDPYGTIARFSLRLLPFDYVVIFRRGASHNLPDFLSRIPYSEMDAKLNEEEEEEDLPTVAVATVKMPSFTLKTATDISTDACSKATYETDDGENCLATEQIKGANAEARPALCAMLSRELKGTGSSLNRATSDSQRTDGVESVLTGSQATAGSRSTRERGLVPIHTVSGKRAACGSFSAGSQATAGTGDARDPGLVANQTIQDACATTTPNFSGTVSAPQTSSKGEGDVSTPSTLLRPAPKTGSSAGVSGSSSSSGAADANGAEVAGEPTHRGCDTAEMIRLQRSDRECRDVYRALNSSQLSGADGITYARGKTAYRDFVLLDGILYKLTKSGRRVFLPFQLRHKAIVNAHDNLTSGHFGISRTVARIQRNFYWPKMFGSVRNYVVACEACQRYKSPQVRQQGLLCTTKHEQPWATVYTDHLGPLVTSKSGNKYLLVFQCGFTRWAEIVAVKDATACVTARMLVQRVFSIHGAPLSIVSDGGPAFRANVWNETCRLLGIKHHMTTPYMPQSNRAERLNRDLIRALGIYATTHADWDVNLHLLQFALNTATNETTGFSPFQLTFGRTPRELSDFVSDSERQVQLTTVSQYASSLKSQLNLMAGRVKEVSEGKQLKYKGHYDKKKDPARFCVGDLVLAETNLQSKKVNKFTAKLAPRYFGPFEITEKLSDVTYILTCATTNKVLGKRHSSQLKPYYSNEQFTAVDGNLNTRSGDYGQPGDEIGDEGSHEPDVTPFLNQDNGRTVPTELCEQPAELSNTLPKRTGLTVKSCTAPWCTSSPDLGETFLCYKCKGISHTVCAGPSRTPAAHCHVCDV